jgi:serine/threonine-protein kinase
MRELCRLWDEAQEIEPAARAAWLDGIQASSPALLAALKDMLESPDAGDRAPGNARLHAGIAFAGFEGLLAELGDGIEEGGSDSRVGPYRLVREIGSGGMATVWLAERADGLMQRQVAVKCPHAWLGSRFLERFGQERQILASLTHPNIARLYDAGLTARGRPYLVLEYVDGESLTDYADRRDLSMRERLVLFLQVLDAVQFAHEHHVVHRDLKPSNVLVSSDGTAHLLDFGIAKLLAEGEEDIAATQFADGALTPAYAAPEQLEGNPAGPLADVYALGVLLFQLLTGQLPYPIDLPTRAAVKAALLTGAIPRPSEVARRDARGLRGDLDAIVMTAMRREPRRRFVSARAFANDVRRYLAGERVLSRPDSLGYTARTFVRRYRPAVAAAALVVASLGTGLVAAWRSAQEAHEQQRIAQEQEKLAKESARAASEIQTFLEDLFNENALEFDRSRKSGDLTARELLDIGAARIDKSFKDAPESRVRLLGVMGNLYAQLNLQDKAQQMLRERVAAARKLKASSGRLLVDSLLDYGLALLNGESATSPRETLEEARAVLDRIAPAKPEDNELRGRLELEYAYMLSQTDRPAAVRHTELAITLLKPFAHSDNYAVALSFLADDQIDNMRYARAIATLDEALRVSEAADMQRVQILAQLCRVRVAVGEAETGIQHCRQAYDVMRRQLGEARGDASVFARILADALIDAGRPRQAREVMQELLPVMRNLPAGVTKRNLGSVYEMLASAEIHLGRPAVAQHWLQALASLQLDTGKEEGGGIVLLPEASEALVALGQGRFAAAQAAANKGLAIAAARNLAKECTAQELRAVLVRAQMGRGNLAAAESAMQDMATAARWPTDEPAHPMSLLDLDSLLLRAQLALARGSALEAQSLAAELRRRVRSQSKPDGFARWLQPLEIVLGRIELADGRAEAAAAHFAQAAALAPPPDEDSLATAEAWAWQAKARLARGDVEGARKLIARANGIAHRQAASPFVLNALR